MDIIMNPVMYEDETSIGFFPPQVLKNNQLELNARHSLVGLYA